MGCQQHAWPAHAPEQVEAEVNYIRDNGQRPVAYTYPAPAGTPQRSALLQPTRVAIRNARLLAQPASLEREGFQLVREASAVGDFEDEAQVRERYYPESIALLRRLTGAAEAVIFDHTLRVDQAGRELVLLPAPAAGGSAAAEDLRFAGGRAGPPRRAHRLRRSLHPGRCAAAAEYRTALPAVLRRMSQAGRRLIQ